MLLTLHSVRESAVGPEAARVHVVCGGGSGAGVLSMLTRAGFHVSAGVLNRMDSDQLAAEALGIETVVEAPFSPVGAAARAECARLMEQAQTLLITPVPIGKGNLVNLELAQEAQAAGKEIVLLGDTAFARRDYTGGKATALLERLLANGAARFDRVEDWLQHI